MERWDWAEAERVPSCSEISPPSVWYKTLPTGGGFFRNITVLVVADRQQCDISMSINLKRRGVTDAV
eukprot:1647230-Rhodomonas_salina.1